MSLGNNKAARPGGRSVVAGAMRQPELKSERKMHVSDEARARANLDLLHNALPELRELHQDAPLCTSFEAPLDPEQNPEELHQDAPERTSFQGAADEANALLAWPQHPPEPADLRPALRRRRSSEEPAAARLEAELSAQQMRAIGLLLLGKSMMSVARIVGVDRSTLYRWRQQKDFATVLRFRQEVLFHEAIDGLRISLVRAVHEIKAELASKYRHVRLQSAYRLLPYVGSAKLRPPDRPRAAASAQAVAVPEEGG